MVYVIREINLLALVLLIAMGLFACRSENTCQVKPELFCEKFSKLVKSTPPEQLNEVKSTSRFDASDLHANFGMHVRNSLGLWSTNEVTEFFRNNQVDDPDAMSYVITIGFRSYLKGEPLDMAVLSKKLLISPPPPPPPPLEQVPIRRREPAILTAQLLLGLRSDAHAEVNLTNENETKDVIVTDARRVIDVRIQVQQPVENHLISRRAIDALNRAGPP